jgi:hypothetical protein
LAASVKACALKSSIVYAPVPTGSAMTSVVGSMSLHRCSGTIGVRPSRAGPVTNAGWSQVKVTCVSSAAVTVPSKPLVLIEGVSSSISKVKTTSSAVKASPSDQVASSRRVTSSCVPSAFQVYSLPSRGS